MGRDTIIVTGTATDVCCEATAVNAMELGFKVIVVSDATVTNTKENHETSLNKMSFYYAQVISTDELVREIEVCIRSNATK